MSCLFRSCFGRSSDGYGADDSAAQSRRVLVRNSTEKETETFSYRRSSLRTTESYTDEKSNLKERDSLLADLDEDAHERSTYISEKQLETGADGPLMVEQRFTQERRLTKKSVLFRPGKKSKSGKGQCAVG
jgi:hypothetical protein